MAKRNGSILDDLALIPWWVNVVLAVIVYLSLKYWIPTIKFENSFYAGTAKAADVLAPFLAVIILAPAAVSAFNSWRKGQLREKQKDVGSNKSISLRKFDKPVSARTGVKKKPSSVNLNPIISGAKPSDNICPLCGGEMVLKTAKKGPKAGEDFWSCLSYPKCRGKKPRYV